VNLTPLEADSWVRGNVRPALTAPGPPIVARPTVAHPQELNVADVLLVLRAAVGFVQLSSSPSILP